MQLPERCEVLRIFLGERNLHDRRPLYRVVVEEARRHGLAGATVVRGIIGFGAPSRIHSASILRLSDDLPVIVEIVDRPERIASFLPVLDGILGDGLVVIEEARVLHYGARRRDDAPPAG